MTQIEWRAKKAANRYIKLHNRTFNEEQRYKIWRMFLLILEMEKCGV